MGTYHDILGVKEGASMSEIKRAHRLLARKYHPDAGGSEEQMKQINEAKEGLLAGKSGPNDERPAHMGRQFDSAFFTPPKAETNPYAGRVGVDDPMASGSFDWRHAPDDNLGGYSYAQHMREMENERRGDERSDEIKKQTRDALAQGWTEERAQHFKCSWCGDSMEVTAPHEMLNKINRPDYKNGKWVTEKLVGMHDECREDAIKGGSSNDHCEHCGETLAEKDKVSNGGFGTHDKCEVAAINRDLDSWGY